MEQISGLPVFEVEFDKEGAVIDDGAVTALIDHVTGTTTTDLVVVSHGWNNDKDDARKLYRAFLTHVGGLLTAGGVPQLAGRRLAVLAVLWPSKKFTDAELIPGGSAGIADTDSALRDMLDALKTEPQRLGVEQPIEPERQQALEQAKALVPSLESDAAAQAKFVELVRSVLSADQAHADDGSDLFFSEKPKKLMDDLAEPVPPVPRPAGQGGAASVGDGEGAAGLLGDLWTGAKGAARRLLNFTTYYRMKARAGTVGSTGVAEVLRRVRERAPAVKLHLVGHSFGGRLVTAAVDALGPAVQTDSLTLLQAAYSHNGLAREFDGRSDGFFRKIVTEQKVRGPIVITCTKNDVAVGIAYPLASRVARQNAAALGDADDPYGGLGRNGAQHTPECEDATLLDAGKPYAWSGPKTIHNLNADAFISGHSDIARRETAWAMLSAIART